MSSPNHRDENQKNLEQEIATHLEMSARDHEDRGASSQQAAQAARREFGNAALVEHVTRDQWRGRWLEDLTQDLRHGARLLRRSPGFTIIAVLTLALGIGANTAIFSLVNSILLRPLPYAHAEQLVSINGNYPKGALVALRERSKTMDLAAYAEGYEFNLTGLGDPIRLSGTPVSAELFSILGAKAAIGRTFQPGDDAAGKNSFVILSNSLWQRQFKSDLNILGHLITLDGMQREIVGVMPADFRFPSPQTEVWTPIDIDPRNAHAFWGGDFMPTIARLRPGATLQQADTEIRFLQPQIATMFPWPMPKDWNPELSAVSLQTGMLGDVRSRLLILLAAVVLVLLIACANVANLTLSRGSVREKEIAIRASMGAARHRIMRQLITESVLMASFGGALGLLLASVGLTLLKSTLPADTPGLGDVAIDWRVLVFTAALVIFTGIVSGIAPAFQSSRAELTESLKAGGRGSTLSKGRRVRSILVIGELALAVLLVSAAGLLIHSLWALSHVNPGFHSDNVLTARITPNENFCGDQGRCFSFYRDLLREARALPGVEEASLINTLPLGGRLQKRSSDVEGYVPTTEKPAPLFWLNTISPGYFNSMRIPIASGREFTEADTTGNPRSVIISAETARRFFPNQDAVGKHMRLIGQEDWCTIVGVANDVRAYDLRRNLPTWMDGMIYVPYGPGATREDGSVPAQMTLVLRSASAVPQLEKSIRELTASLNPEAPVSDLKAMPDILSGETAAPRSIASLFAAFAALALVLGVIGIYGVISFFVGQRTREIGIRIAMGAQRRDILKLVVNEGLTLTLIGIGAGLAAAFALTSFLTSFLYGVSATDPLDFAAVAALFATVALVASYIPARRAMRVDPLTALRYE
ncbi:MAG TPA: ABC transporter permease [Candidatus Acidoferrum sp.]|jgi:putative ABC transport system permease protein